MKLLRYYYLLRNSLFNIPSEVFMQYSDRCNLKCIQCRFWKIRNLPNLSLKQKKSIIKKIKNELGYFTVTLTGGEILLDKTFFSFLSFCKKNSISVNLTTNATLINDKVAKRISKFDNLRLTLSIDGSNAQTHDYLRGVNGTFEKVMIAIRSLNKYKFSKINTNTVVSGVNYTELLDIIQLCLNNNIKKMNFVPVILENYNDYKKNILWPKEIGLFNNEIDKLFLIDRNVVSISGNRELIRIKKYFNNPFDNTEKCMNGPNLIRIDRYGNLFMCNKRKEIYGNIIEENLSEILKSKSRKLILNKMSKCKLPCKFFICIKKKSTLDYFGILINNITSIKKFP